MNVEIELTLNGERVSLEAPPEMTLLWVLRDRLRLTGTKFGCGIAQCGACTVHVDGNAHRACVTPSASELKSPADSELIGQEGPRVDTAAKSAGSEQLTADAWREERLLFVRTS